MDESEELKKCKNHIDSLLEHMGHSGLQDTSYPSRCLDFLKQLRDEAPKPRNEPKTSQRVSVREAPPAEAKVKLKIIVAGAGLGGLAAAIALRRRGHDVTIFEKAPQLGEVGAGIQVPPNSSRLLLQWGLGPYLQGKAVEPECIRLRRWQDGSILSSTNLRPDFRERFGAPWYTVHRANLQLAMYELALSLGVVVRVNAGVMSYTAENPSVVWENGERHNADLVVAADGIKSDARRVVLGGIDQPAEQCGFAAYRAMVDTSLMKNDPDVSWLLETTGQNSWIGKGRHVMTYSIVGGKFFNVVLSHPEESDPSTWNQSTVIEDMKEQFRDWDPSLVKLISMIRTTLKWPLLCGRPLQNWLSPSGNLIIIGDAAHSMVPYMASGAAVAVEDGGALAEILSLIQSRSELRAALEVFERQRLLRTSQMQEASLVNGKLWHFADGPEQEARDVAMRLQVEKSEIEESPSVWGDRVTAQWAYGYDAEAEIKKAWAEFRGTSES